MKLLRRSGSEAPRRSVASTRAPQGGDPNGQNNERLDGCAVLIGRALAVGLVGLFVAAAIGVAVIAIPWITSMQAEASPAPSASATPMAGHPLLIQPQQSVLAAESTSIAGTLPADLIERTSARLRIRVTYGDGSNAIGGEIAMPTTPNFEVTGIPLLPGENKIVAIVLENDVEGASSNQIVIERDNVAPKISLSSPDDNAMISGSEVTVSGKTDPDIDVQLRNDTTGTIESGRSSKNGTFDLTISVRNGSNILVISASDVAGNGGEKRLTIISSSDTGLVTIDVNPGTIILSKPNRSFRVTARATGPDGSPVVSVCVQFTLQLTGLPIQQTSATSPCIVSDTNGRASWEYTIPDTFDTVGQGLVMVSYVMPVGDPLEETTRLYVKKQP